jgi:hypothetical protein
MYMPFFSTRPGLKNRARSPVGGADFVGRAIHFEMIETLYGVGYRFSES